MNFILWENNEQGKINAKYMNNHKFRKRNKKGTKQLVASNSKAKELL
jgi:hypothetical protein